MVDEGLHIYSLAEPRGRGGGGGLKACVYSLAEPRGGVGWGGQWWMKAFIYILWLSQGVGRGGGTVVDGDLRIFSG